MLDDTAMRVQRTYDAAADHYDTEPLSFWLEIGRRTVDRLALPAGAEVLDAPCGAGASALAAAAQVGPRGRVVAVDLAQRLLELGRARAAAEGLTNVEFLFGDMRALDLPDTAFDAVVCVFGIFFVQDMVAQVRRFWRLLRPGGVLAITTWGEGMFAPGDAAFWDAVAAVRPDLVRGFNPWEALVTAAGLQQLYATAGIAASVAVPDEALQPLRSPEDFWAITLGSGYRATVDALAPAERAAVRIRVLGSMTGVAAVRIPIIYGAASKPLG